MSSVMGLFNFLEVQDNNPHFMSRLDVLFDDLEQQKPNAFCCKL